MQQRLSKDVTKLRDTQRNLEYKAMASNLQKMMTASGCALSNKQLAVAANFFAAYHDNRTGVDNGLY